MTSKLAILTALIQVARLHMEGGHMRAVSRVRPIRADSCNSWGKSRCCVVSVVKFFFHEKRC